MGFRGFVLRFHAELMPCFYLMINAPNAIRKDLAGAPFSVGKFLAYSASNSFQGMSDAIFTQRLSADNFPPKGSSNSDGGLRASSTFRYRFVDGDARVLTYFTSQSCTLLSIARSLNLSPPNLRSIIQQALNENFHNYIMEIYHLEKGG